jgi:hypothetical protein
MLSSPRGRNDDAAVNSPDFAQTPQSVSLVLEITRGRTRYRRRPVTGPRFLIGAGSTCDLRFGGDRIPALHSLLTVTAGNVQIEAISPEPPLLVNRQPVHIAALHDGDLIQIGDMELLTHVAADVGPAQVQVAAPQPSLETDVAGTPMDDISNLSAAELVDLIEQEEQEIDAFEARRRDGARALAESILARHEQKSAERFLHAAESRVPGRPHLPSAGRRRLTRPPVPVGRDLLANDEHGADADFMNGLEHLANQMAGLSQELHSNSRRATEREATYADAANLLLEAQQKLVSQLETLLEQVQTLQQQQSGPKLHTRAIA